MFPTLPPAYNGPMTEPTLTPISLAIETTCRAGGVAMGLGETLRDQRPLGTTGRHAAELLAQIDEMLVQAEKTPGDVGEFYVSVGPGSFTGIRVGVTVARTLAQVQPAVSLVAVPTPLAIAQQVCSAPWEHLAVFLAAKEGAAHITPITRDASGGPILAGEAVLATPDEFFADREDLDRWHVAGEALGFCDLPPACLAAGVTLADQADWLPRIESVWQVGWRLARAGQFTPYAQLRPVYARRPEAVRLWDAKQNV